MKTKVAEQATQTLLKLLEQAINPVTDSNQVLLPQGLIPPRNCLSPTDGWGIFYAFLAYSKQNRADLFGTYWDQSISGNNFWSQWFPLATRKELWDRRRKHNEQKAAQLEKERNQNLVDYLKRRDIEARQFEEREAKKLQNWLNDRQNDWQGNLIRRR